MADKKVGRYGSARLLSPTEKMDASLSDPGTLDVAKASHDKTKKPLADKFRAREDKWRLEQSMSDRAGAWQETEHYPPEHPAEHSPEHPPEHTRQTEAGSQPGKTRLKGGAL
jgi:hypothetical protein